MGVLLVTGFLSMMMYGQWNIYFFQVYFNFPNLRMKQYSCSAFYIGADNEHQQVTIISNNGALLIKTVLNDQQMVYLPAGSMDTILYFGREVSEDQEMYTLDLENPETQIKVSFLVSQKDSEELQNQLRGKQVFFRFKNPRILSQLAPGIQLIQTQNNVMVEKMAVFPKNMIDQASISRLCQLKQEADILSLLKEQEHQNIIKLEEIVTDGESVSIILENCQGGDLLKLLNKKTIKMDVPLVMINLLTGLKHLHEQNIVHRDIKLQNILFLDAQNANTLKIADFGLSCFKQQIPYYNPRCGTPGYTAPEVYSQQCIYDEKVDIYSAGIILYNMLTLKNPFGNSKNIQDIIKRNISGQYDETHLVNVKINNPLGYDLLLKMLQKDARNRPSAKECLLHPFFDQEIYEIQEDQNSIKHETQKRIQTTKRVKI
ncbi:unnamed protein product [Paramecium sonneborni]|uniref:Protein kinase domain-containing protein n=1 Tax=Paramecium sonneborni TaxID=65129 RepID=A0A8S1NC68_9CILI|nr:unnamed protein product [Paramecium sonneborni]